VRAAVAPVHLDARVASVQISQQLAGHDVALLDERDEWFLVRGADDYDGWVHRGYLALEEDGRRQASVRRQMSLGCVVQSSSGATRALPLRAWLAADERAISGEVIDAASIASRFPATPDAIAESARRFFVGTAYQWGGVTPWGADCSGFAQAMFSLHGVSIPRDAWQQSDVGVPGAPAIDEARAADLLFFSDRADQKITHVALALGEGRLAHVALGRGGFHLEQVGDTADGYVGKLRERFLFTRRVL
jgi:cell wall-associated NlpC family hydrolase